MNNHLRAALSAARLRWAPGALDKPSRVPPCCAASWRHVQGSFPASDRVAPDHGVQRRPYSAAPIHSEGETLVDEEEDEVDRKIRQMERRREVRAAQKTFMEYLHVTRGMCFSDAEHISKRSPVYLSKLLEEVKDALKEPPEGGTELVFRSKVKKRDMKDERVSKALVRLFQFNPVNEFEPFLESIGLRPSECSAFLPRDLMFLTDDEMLLGNFRLLCNYGIARRKIGRIYRDAMEVFSFGHGVLASKLKALEELGFSRTSVIKLVIATPVVLVRDPNVELKILEWLDDIGIQRDWISQFLSAKKSYDWRKMVRVPQFFINLGFTKEGVGKLVRQNPDFLLDGSGKMLFTAVLMMLKAGCGKKELYDLFMDFPNVSVEDFTSNLRRGMLFLAEIGISDEDVNKFVLSHGLILGSAPLKMPNSIVTNLNVGKRRLRKIILEDPKLLMSYTLGSKVSQLPKIDPFEASFSERIKFLKSIGFVEGSEDMKKALKTFRGKGDELQDRYEFLVNNTGLDPKDVVNMIKLAPQVLNQRIDVLESKISFLVNGSGYTVSDLVAFPAYLSFTVERSKVRILTYKWLLERGVVRPRPALSTILACSDKCFMSYFVKKHPMGSEVWENYKREVTKDKNMPCS
ncbi:hypothetical protein CFC21_102523 [Triticum aestivum]|uniref:Uncharacterized protein n=3 Tax=Triticum TaxID=4564 RepID=A0A9R0ZZN0_TRITD|nr:transcription termination factor MTEF18, mitochondrial-like [Triticum aestivum]KAF7101125.1 hypothetical protein CFC21_102523 [Triticum aestivum]VAI86259.1 unnamed protein product [Triticum turgidum subsp. durum]